MEATLFQNLHKDLMTLISEVYWQGCQDERNESRAFDEGFRADVGEELSAILHEHGFTGDGIHLGGA